MSELLAINPKPGQNAQLFIDSDDQTVFLDGVRCILTRQEFSLLSELAQNADVPVSREQLLKAAWGYVCPGETRTVDVHIQRLRKKLGFSVIETIYKFGYRLRAVRS